MGWKGESRRHSLARKGIRTNIDQERRFDVSTFVARGNNRLIDKSKVMKVIEKDGMTSHNVFEPRYDIWNDSVIVLIKYFDNQEDSFKAKKELEKLGIESTSMGTVLFIGREPTKEDIELYNQPKFKKGDPVKIGDDIYTVRKTGYDRIGGYDFVEVEEMYGRWWFHTVEQVNKPKYKFWKGD